MRLIGGIVLFFGLLVTFILTMFVMLAEAQADQTSMEKRLAECTTDLDCQEAYDAIYGFGADAEAENKVEKGIEKCDNDKECEKAYDAAWGVGAWDKMVKAMKNCSEWTYNPDCPDPNFVGSYGE